MNHFLYVTAVDENGSGLEFPASINPECIEAVLDLSSYELRPAKSNAAITLKNKADKIYVADTRKDIMQKLVYL